MTIIQNIVGGLLESEFKIVNGLYNTTNIGEDTQYICLYKSVGAMLYAVAIINCDKAYDYQDKVSGIRNFFQAYYEKLEVKNIILTEVLISQKANAEVLDYAEIKNFNLEAELIEVRWVVERDGKKIIIPDGQPTEILNLNTILENALKNDGDYSVGVELQHINEKNKQNKQKYIKSKNIFLTFFILIINGLVLLAMELNGGSTNSDVLLRFGAIYPDYIFRLGEYYRLITHMFLHIGITHYLANSLSLYIFGSRVEKYYGKTKMLIIYLISGVTGGLLACLVTPDTIMAGASGAIFGLMGAILSYVFINKRSADGFDLYFLALFTIIGLGSGFLISGVSNAGHLGGFIGGTIVGYIMNKLDFKSE